MSNELPLTPSGPDGDREKTDVVDSTPAQQSGPGMPDAAGYQVNKDELLVLAGDYVRKIRGWCFTLRLQYSWKWQCECNDLCGHLDRLATVLGDAAIDAIVAESDREGRANYGTAAWRARADEFADRFFRELDRLEEKAKDPDARARAIAHLSDHPSDLFLDPNGDMWFLAMGPVSVLNLMLRSRIGLQVRADFYMSEPDGWFPPYGISLLAEAGCAGLARKKSVPAEPDPNDVDALL